MSTVDPRTLELIQAELDGELDAAGQAELSARLADDAEARVQREQLQRMAQTLSQLAPVEPPAGLSQRWQSARAVAPVTLRQPARRRWIGRGGLAMAAATLLCALALGLSDMGRQQLDSRDLVGTLGPDAGAGRTVPVELDGVRGSIALASGASGWDLVFDLDSAEPVAVSANYDPAALRWDGYSHTGAGDVAVDASPGKIAFVNQGVQHLVLHLRPGTGGQVLIRFQDQSGSAQELAISVPAGSR